MIKYLKIAVPLFVVSQFAAPLLGPLFTVAAVIICLLYLVIAGVIKTISAIFRWLLH